MQISLLEALREPGGGPDVTTLLLLRHGQTQWNVQRRFQGQTDIPLDDVGYAQACAAGLAVAEAKPCAVWSSDSSRALVTAQAIGLPVRADSRLREIALGSYEGLTPEDWEADDPEAHALWRAGHDVRRGGGETYQEVGIRATAAVQEALESMPDPDGLLVVVAHGGTIRGLLMQLMDLPPSPWSHMAVVGNCCGALLSHEDDGRGWRLLRYGVPAEFLLQGVNG